MADKIVSALSSAMTITTQTQQVELSKIITCKI